MIAMKPLKIGEKTALGIEVKLPKTTLLAISTDLGCIMCGTFDVGLFLTLITNH
jgi:uncharacterized protein YunC (DUF1805 family)